MQIKRSLNSKKSLLEHKKVISQKKFLNLIYRDYYQEMKRVKVPKGIKVELGSGGGFIKKVIPQIITSDVIAGPEIDRIIKAEKMPFKDKTVAAFYMFNVFHHIKNVEKALGEMHRCLKTDGKIVMIEPFNSWWGYIVYKYIHYEHFDVKANWEISGKGRLSDSNLALVWIVFERDRKLFERKFPQLRINMIKPHTPFRYLVAGGLTRLQFIPSFCYPLVVFTEKLLSPFNKYIGMYVTVELKKVGN